jgi:diguanylate cyclase (GGDEF)-like protein
VRVLLVDDDPVSLRLLEAAVPSFGHVADTRCDGEAAWTAFESSPYDVVISDRDMPGISGVDLCRRLRAHEVGRRAYVVIVTGRDQRQDILDGMAAGADDYLTKPLQVDDLQLRMIAAARTTELHVQLEEATSALRVAARTDPLTGVRNRLAMQEDLQLLHDRVTRYGGKYCLALVDVDHFKAFNDSYGHLAGDEALRQIASRLRGTSRSGDAVYRFGGEEFVCVLPEQLLGTAAIALERMRADVANLGIEHTGNASGVVTISAGIVCSGSTDRRTPEQLLAAADLALYRAKEGGRDRVELETAT